MWEPSYFSFVGCCFEKPTQLFFHWSREREENDPRRDRPKVSTTTRAKRPDRVLVASCWNYLRLLTSSCYTHREREREKEESEEKGLYPFLKKKQNKTKSNKKPVFFHIYWANSILLQYPAACTSKPNMTPFSHRETHGGLCFILSRTDE